MFEGESSWFCWATGVQESASRSVSCEGVGCALFGDLARALPFERECSKAAVFPREGWISPLARGEVIEGGDRGVGVVVIMGTGEEGEMGGGGEERGLRLLLDR